MDRFLIAVASIAAAAGLTGRAGRAHAGPADGPGAGSGSGSGSGSEAPAGDAVRTVGGETIVVVGAAPRGGPGDLVGTGEGARDRGRALAAAPFVTVVHVDDHAGERATAADLVGATVGAHVRSLGGLGAFSSVSVRGEAPGQTAVFVDGVPVSRIAAVTADLGRFDADDVDRVELYRGGAPVELGGAALGGALNLVTPLGRGPHGERWRAAIGLGSFGARSTRLSYGDGDPAAGTAYWIGGGYAGSFGDFVYFDDGGTNLDPSDDRWTRRKNNGYDQLDAAIRAGGTRAGWRWRAGGTALVKRQGVPGSAWQQSMRGLARHRERPGLGRGRGRAVGRRRPGRHRARPTPWSRPSSSAIRSTRSASATTIAAT